MSVIAGIHGVLGEHCYPQADITQAFAQVVSPDGSFHKVIERIHEATGIQTRHLALPLSGYANLENFGAANDTYIRLALDLAEVAVTGALDSAGLTAADVSLILATSITGIAVPSIDARLVSRLGLPADVKRLPIFGLGCVAGAAGIARLHDYLIGHPDDIAVLVSVELCSLTIQRDDTSMANIVASGLFGDGAAAVVMVGERRVAQMGLTGPRVIASRSRMYPDTERTMGWDIGGSGFRIVLSPGVAEVITTYIGDDVSNFLSSQELTSSDIAHWVCHPGGPKVLHAMESALELNDGQLDITWRSLAAIGNLSSASVLHVLRDTIEGTGAELSPSTPFASATSTGTSASTTISAPVSGTFGLLTAMGPGFCVELVLLQW